MDNFTIEVTDLATYVQIPQEADGVSYSYQATVDTDGHIITEDFSERRHNTFELWEVTDFADETATQIALYDTYDPDEEIMGRWHEKADTVVSDLATGLGPAKEELTDFRQRYGHVTILDRAVRERIKADLQPAALAYAQAITHASAPRPKVTIYTKPDCVQCQATLRRLDAAGVSYTLTDLSKDPDMVEHMRAAGFTTVPIVEYGEERFAGYRPDRIKALTQTFGALSTANADQALHVTAPPRREPPTESRSR